VLKTTNNSALLLAQSAVTNDAAVQLTQMMMAGGFIDEAQAAELAAGLESGDTAAAATAANGLQMVAAAYMAGADTQTMEGLAERELGDREALIASMGTTEGAANYSALSLQYALALGCSQSDFNVATLQVTEQQQVTLFPPKYETVVVESFDSVSECLASDWAAENPVEALALIQSSESYTDYRDSGQYQQDMNGFVGSMSALGENLAAIGYDSYLQNGIEDENAQTVLGVVLGQ